MPAVAIELVHSEPEARAAVELLKQIWSNPIRPEPLPPELAWVFAHSGNYVSVARVDGELVGAAIGFRGVDESGPHLHSHIAGVLSAHQGANIGFALKQHQREWALAAGLDRITWTFDPLVARNAYFNVMKLGATISNYYVDFYGPMEDGINSGDETDRCLATWSLSTKRTVDAARGAHPVLDVETLRAAGGRPVLTVGADGSPEPVAEDAAVRLVQLPADIVSLRTTQPDVAGKWRRALREMLRPAFDEGLEVIGVTRDSWYVLGRAESASA